MANSSKSSHASSKNDKRTDELLMNSSIDELIDQMRNVNESIKTNKFSTVLGGEIYEICEILKERGKELEERNKADLNKFFDSIRLASCRENGELGLPCRLKIMELLELRVMGWRTNLSHAQYYSKRAKELENVNEERGRDIPQPTAPQPMAPQILNKMGPPAALHIGQPPPPPPHPTSSSSASSSLPPFSPFGIPPPPPCLLFNSPVDNPIPPGGGFFFIPSRAGTFVPHASPGMFPSRLASAPQFMPAPTSLFATQQFSQNAKHFAPNLLESLSIGNEIKSISKVIPSHQFREEITIRNSDSGKVMGVKGRRVALIEELSKTVISFQKVDPKCKERQLSIIADEQGAIECAKRLIGDTIERNVSPERPANPTDTLPMVAENGDNAKVDSKSSPPPKQAVPIRIFKEADGSLKIASEDPTILAAAQDAVHDYLRKLENLHENVDENNEAGGRGYHVDKKATPRIYDRSTLLDIRQRCEKDANLIGQAKRQLASLDIFEEGRE